MGKTRLRKLLKNDYTQVPNSIIGSKELSFRDKGLYAFIQSKPDGWSFSAKGISSQSGDGLHSVNAGLKSLENSGYLQRQKYQDKETGFWGIEYVLYEDIRDNKSYSGKSDAGKSDAGKSDEGKPYEHSNTDLSNTDLSNKERERGSHTNSEILNKENYIPKSDETATSYLHNYWKNTIDDKYSRWWIKKGSYGHRIKQLGDKEVKTFIERFNNQVILDNIPFDERKLFARLNNYAMSWITNHSKNKESNNVTAGYRTPGMV